MKEFKGKWCINITDENKSYLKEHLKCGAGYYKDQTIFYDENGISGNPGNRCISWNIDRNNTCLDIKYDEITFIEFQNMINGIKGELTYDIY